MLSGAASPTPPLMAMTAPTATNGVAAPESRRWSRTPPTTRYAIPSSMITPLAVLSLSPESTAGAMPRSFEDELLSIPPPNGTALPESPTSNAIQIVSTISAPARKMARPFVHESR